MTDLQDFLERLKPNTIVRGPLFPEPIQVITTQPVGQGIKLIGTGTRTNQTYLPVLEADQLALLIFTYETEPFDGV